jgi:hypothetical protein
VEQAHRELTGVTATHGVIVVALYEETGSVWRAAALCCERYGVSVSGTTVSRWLKRGWGEALAARISAA